jgi:teichuronic acid biosynthesis glycosyltransferase TuaH
VTVPVPGPTPIATGQRVLDDAGPDYVVFGTVPWDSPWLTEHNLASALAARRRVLYVEPPVSVLSPFRYSVRRGSFEELRRLLGKRLRATDRLHVLRPFTAPPREHPHVRAAAAPVVRQQIRRAVRQLGMRDPVVVAARSVLPYLGAAGEQGCVYIAKDLVEAGAALIGKDAALLAAEQLEICCRADLVLAVTRSLQSTLRDRGIESVHFPHGFHAELAGRYDAARPPAAYDALPGPRLGYAGRIDGRLDFEALAELADRFRDGSIVLIGPVSPRLPAAALAPLRSRSNVHLLGTRTRDDLPAYLSHLDCCLMPYREGEWGRHGSPLKLWDYLYAGPPVVGTGYSTLRDIPLVRYASPSGRLADAVEDALRENERGSAERRAFAMANTWDERAATLDELVHAHISSRLQT